LETAGRLLDRVKEVLALVNSNTNLRVNLPIGAAYFATGRGVSFAWHQDHESFYSIQNHYDYLNFYVPIVKPRRDKSNLSIVPFDVLEKESPETFREAARSGAARYRRIGSCRLAFLDDTGSVHRLRADLDRIAHTPLLDAGDLLLMRGDMIHQTQDTETERVAVSVRATSAGTVVHRSRLAQGGWVKARVMMNNPTLYEQMFRAFDEAGKDAMELRELFTIMGGLPVPKARKSGDFFRYLLRQKRREHALIPFFRRTPTSVLADGAVSLYERWSRH